jgi:hypothetical protein
VAICVLIGLIKLGPRVGLGGASKNDFVEKLKSRFTDKGTGLIRFDSVADAKSFLGNPDSAVNLGGGHIWTYRCTDGAVSFTIICQYYDRPDVVSPAVSYTSSINTY